jgi:hypothetical protein
MKDAFALAGTTVNITGMPGGTEGNRGMLKDFRVSGRVLNPAAPYREHEC